MSPVRRGEHVSHSVKAQFPPCLENQRLTCPALAIALLPTQPTGAP